LLSTAALAPLKDAETVPPAVPSAVNTVRNAVPTAAQSTNTLSLNSLLESLEMVLVQMMMILMTLRRRDRLYFLMLRME
jgi:hypothetical protein